MKKVFEIIGNIVGVIGFIAFFYGMLLVGSAFEDNKRCMNGAEEYCIAEDFQK